MPVCLTEMIIFNLHVSLYNTKIQKYVYRWRNNVQNLS